MQARHLITAACLTTLWLLMVSPCAAESAGAAPGGGLLQLSARTINLLFERQVDELQTIHEVVLGAPTSGLARVRGQVTAALIPDPHRAALEVRLEGTAKMNGGVSERRAISILSSTNTTIDARKRVLMDDTGLYPQSAEATCTSRVRVDDIESRRQLIERIAWRRTLRMLGQLEDAASRQAEVRCARHLDEECDALLGEVDQAYREMVREPLVREGIWPARLMLRTTADHVHLTAVGAKPSPTGTPAIRPRVDPNHDIAVCLHESLVRDLGASALSNRTVSDRQWLELVKLATGHAPRPLWVHDRSEPWQVTFAAESPLTVNFADNGLTVSLHFRELDRGERRHEGSWTVSSIHRLEIADQGPVLVRQGELQIRFRDGAAPSPDQAELTAFLARKFDSILPAELYFDGLVPPAGASWELLRRLKLMEFQASSGWLVLGYQLERRETALAQLQRP
jgi:hypothetical protein